MLPRSQNYNRAYRLLLRQAGYWRGAALAFLGTLFGLVAQFVQAEAWPLRPIQLTVIGAPGSAPDTIARELGDSIGRALGQPIVVENRSGGAGIVGMVHARNASPARPGSPATHPMRLVDKLKHQYLQARHWTSCLQIALYLSHRLAFRSARARTSTSPPSGPSPTRSRVRS